MTHPYLAGVLDATRAFVRTYVVFGATHADAVALWNAHTYVYDCAVATPYLHPHSPEPGSGKTTLLDVLDVTAFNPIQADNLTEAVLFRMIDKQHPTLLFDEVDAVFGKKNSDSTEGIRQVLNSGYRRGKKAYRCVGPTHQVVPFDVYCPKATAGLNQLPATLAHRSIPIAMKPPRPDDDYDDFDYEEALGDAETLRINLESWAYESGDVLRDPRLKPAKLPGLDARANEIWRILFRIADQAGGDWPERARAAAVELSSTASRHGDASTAVRLLGDIRDLFDGDRMTCNFLVDLLNHDDMPYGGWNEGKGITTRQLGKKLVPYDIVAKPVRIDGARAGNGYDRDQFEDAWARYLPVNEPPNRYTGTTRMVEPNLADSKPVQNPFVPVSENTAQTLSYQRLYRLYRFRMPNPARTATDPSSRSRSNGSPGTANGADSTPSRRSSPARSSRHAAPAQSRRKGARSMAPETSLEKCERCLFVTGDATPSRRDGVPRCPPCERRTDHERRLGDGDTWYRQCILDYAETHYGPEWEQQPGWDHCVAMFADARAIGGWQAVGVELPAPRSRVPIEERRCPSCGEKTTSVTDFFCAGCHFRGWYGHWRDNEESQSAA